MSLSTEKAHILHVQIFSILPTFYQVPATIDAQKQCYRFLEVSGTPWKRQEPPGSTKDLFEVAGTPWKQYRSFGSVRDPLEAAGSP